MRRACLLSFHQTKFQCFKFQLDEVTQLELKRVRVRVNAFVDLLTNLIQFESLSAT